MAKKRKGVLEEETTGRTKELTINNINKKTDKKENSFSSTKDKILAKRSKYQKWLDLVKYKNISKFIIEDYIYYINNISSIKEEKEYNFLIFKNKLNGYQAYLKTFSGGRTLSKQIDVFTKKHIKHFDRGA